MMSKLKSGNRHENMTIRKVDLKTRNGKINLHWTRKMAKRVLSEACTL